MREREEGHYTIKRVDKLPKKGNANWLYAIKSDTIPSVFRWNAFKIDYEEIFLGNKFTDLQTDYGIVLGAVSTTNNYDDLNNLPLIENNYVSAVALVGSSLEFAGQGYGFVGSVDLSSISFPGFTDLPTDYGVTLSTVATTNNYNDLSNLPIIDLQYVLGNGYYTESPDGNTFLFLDTVDDDGFMQMKLTDGLYNTEIFAGSQSFYTVVDDEFAQRSITINSGNIELKNTNKYLGIRSNTFYLSQPTTLFSATFNLQPPSTLAVNTTFTIPLSVSGIFADTDGNIDISSLAASGLEAINEGSGIGWRLIGRNAANYGNIGSGAVDFSFNATPSAVYGATGSISFAAGGSTIASNSYSAVFGHLSTTSGYAGFASGHFLNSPSYAEAVFGIFNTIYTPVSAVAKDGTDRVFNIGNGNNGADRHDAVTVLKNGKVGIGIDNFETTTSAALLNVNGATQTAGYTVATLPAGSQGMRAYVTDATATTFYSVVAGGGSNVVPVFHNGVNWVIA